MTIAARRTARRRRVIGENLQAYLFLLPAFAVLLVFKIWPAFFAVYISLFKWDIVQGAYRGLENYGDILFGTRAEAFWRSLSTTVTYALITIPFEIGIGLVVAYILFQRIRGRAVYRTLYYLPYVTSTVAAAAVFEWIFHPQYGLVNRVIEALGGQRLTWLQEPDGVFAMLAQNVGVKLP